MIPLSTKLHAAGFYLWAEEAEILERDCHAAHRAMDELVDDARESAVLAERQAASGNVLRFRRLP
jgi:hypothetical protein